MNSSVISQDLQIFDLISYRVVAISCTALWWQMTPFTSPYLGWESVEVLAQHSSHVLPGVGGHLMFEQEGEQAPVSDTVEMAVHLVVFTACEREREKRSH